MKGAHAIRVTSRRTDFKFEVRRSVTVVKGDSGTGKTTLYDLIASHTRLGEASGVTIRCEKRCVALVDIDWKNQLSSINDSIVFIDEGAGFITSKEFAATIQKTDNYYVFFTREDLRELPYSIDEIYRIKTSGKKYHTLERFYKSNDKHIYGRASTRRRNLADYDTLLTEDSKAGFQFYESRFKGTSVSCESAGNNAGIHKRLKNDHDERIFVVADGAAFGSEADRVLKLQGLYPSNITVCLPESFEWLLLNSGLVDASDLADVLGNTPAHIESREHFSWEQFFADYLKSTTQGTPFRYTKGRLPKAFKVPENAAKVMEAIATGNIQ